LLNRAIVLVVTVAVLGYSCAVLLKVATSGDLGLRCVFGVKLKDDVSPELQWTRTPTTLKDHGTVEADGSRWVEVARAGGGSDRFLWSASPPEKGSTVLAIDGQPIALYPDYIRALAVTESRVGEPVEVRWETGDGSLKMGEVIVARRPTRTYLALVWFLQEIVIFAVGALIYWRRPLNEAARMFFWLCATTVGAFMGGYHWSEIVVFFPLIMLFALFAVFVPIVTLHFYMVFPHPKRFFVRHRRPLQAVLYGVPTLFVLVLWVEMFQVRTLVRRGEPMLSQPILDWVQGMALGYVGLSVVIFVLCIACLIDSYRAARTKSERNQVQWILLASLLACLPIGFLLWEASHDAGHLGRDQAAWPMFVVSLLYSAAYAVSLTRYKLLQAGDVLNRSVIYVGLSVTAGLIYSGAIFAGALLIGYGLKAGEGHHGREAILVGITTIIILALSESARQWSQRAIDRRFYRDKHRFDQAMQQMSRAVGSLVDRQTLARQLLGSAAEVLRLEWGAIYLAREPDGPMALVAGHGPDPDVTLLKPDNPLVQRLHEEPVVRPSGDGLSRDHALDAMFALGGEMAVGLDADGTLAGLLVLGPKRSGLPYEAEEVGFVRALASITILALRSAGIQHTLELLNHELRDKVEKIAEQQRRILVLQDQLAGRDRAAQLAEEMEDVGPEKAPRDEAFDRIKGSGPAVRRLIELARKVGPSPSAVLIRGESGTGKELLAEAIHRVSPRASKPFVKIHCAALSQTLLESELFGHVKGAFTGADRDRVGRFEQADGGTLFLDEIGDINLEVQTKLLRVLQSMTFERVGSSQPITVDVRVLAATHQDLEALIRSGKFREDLFYRLNVIPLTAPSLRERKEDIFELAVHFLTLHARRMGKAVSYLEDDAVEALLAYDWPGNIRELENMIERAVVLADGPALTLAELPQELRRASRRRLRRTVPAPALAGMAAPVLAPEPTPFEDEEDDEFRAFERRRLLDALEEAKGNKSEAARLLGLPRSTFFSKLRKYNLT
jgi:transcriptional regulator with GAF, ATPase, and Fis domain